MQEQVSDLTKKCRELSDELSQKTEALEHLQEDTEAVAQQMFEKEKLAYHDKMEELQKIVDITEQDLTADRFLEYVNSRDLYKDVEIRHARQKDIVSLGIGDGLSAKVVFSKNPFIDVAKEIKKPDYSKLMELNNKPENATTKFYSRDSAEGTDKKEVVARKWFRPGISEDRLIEIIGDLADHFEKSK